MTSIHEFDAFGPFKSHHKSHRRAENINQAVSPVVFKTSICRSQMQIPEMITSLFMKRKHVLTTGRTNGGVMGNEIGL